MKKLKLFIIPLSIGMYLTSCTIAHTAVVTNNPVGSKVGVAKAGPFSKDADVSYSKAMENGKISKVGIAEFKATVFIFPTFKTTVTGE
jgi:hypothetical protein